MALIPRLSSLWRNLVHRDRVDRDLDDEVRAVFELLVEEKMQRGLRPEEARRAAALELGRAEVIKDQVRDRRAGAFIDTCAQDLRLAWRGIRATPGPAAAAVLVLALGTGLNTAVLAVAYGVLVRPLPYPEPSELLLIPVGGSDDPDGGIRLSAFDDWDARLRRVDAVAAYATANYTLRGIGEPRVIEAALVTERFFDVLRTTPVAGRAPAGRHDSAAILSERLAQQLLPGRGHDLIGRVVTVADRSFPVVGIMPERVVFPSEQVALWLPARDAPAIELHSGRDARRFRLVARAKANADIEQVRGDARRVLSELAVEEPDTYRHLVVSADALQARLVAPVQPAVVMFVVGAALVLLVACANAGSLLLARAAARDRDVAVRLALGASRARVIRAFLAEGLLIALGGSALGAILALGALRVFTRLAAGMLPRLQEVAIDLPVLLASLAVAGLVALLCGAAPALRVLRAKIAPAFRQTPVAGSRQARRLSSALVVAQIAASVVLLVGASLLTRTVMRLLTVDLGIDSRNTLATTLMLTEAGGFDAAARKPFVSDLLRELGRLPGVQHVGMGSSFPPHHSLVEVAFRTGPSRTEARDTGLMELVAITPGYFHALGIPLIKGRLVEARDGAAGQPVAVISRSASRMIFRSQDPIGQRLPSVVPGTRTDAALVVGVVGDVRYDGLHAPAGGTIYVPWEDLPTGVVNLAVRTSREPLAIAPMIRSVVHRLDPGQPTGDIRPLDDVIAGSIASRRLHSWLAGSFAGVALLLALVGLAAALARAVTERRRELAIRTALGASPHRTVGLMFTRGAALAAVGIAAGLGIAALATQGLAGMLYGLGPRDPRAFVASAAVVGSAALLACYLTTRRIARIDPAELLKVE